MRGARPEASIEQALEREGAIRIGERVLIACSGGVDSVALAAALHAVATPMRLDLTLAHVNHGTRASSWQDECVALRVAASLDLGCVTLGLDRATRADAGAEAALREARYAALLAAARSLGAGVVATAHHAEDQSETVLLALFRGAGPGGLAGMPTRRPLGEGIDLVRPLLRVPSPALQRYVQGHGLPYAIDPTNAEAELRRNAVRRALEALRPLYPGLDGAVARAAELSRDEAAATPRAALRRLVRERLSAEGDLRDLDFTHVEAVVRTLERGGDGCFDMRAGVRLQVERGVIARVERRP